MRKRCIRCFRKLRCQKGEIVQRLTEAMVSVEGENMRDVTWVVIEEVQSGDWAIGGTPLRTDDVKAMLGRLCREQS